MPLLNDYIKVRELTDNLQIDGMLEKYDSTSPYMIAEIVDISAKAEEEIIKYTPQDFTLNDLYKSILIFKRVTKIRGFNGIYVQLQDLIEIVDRNTYNKYVWNK